ncbi:hypothetical protein Hanom_Chr06g00559091 [Helianthus anomalus]
MQKILLCISTMLEDYTGDFHINYGTLSVMTIPLCVVVYGIPCTICQQSRRLKIPLAHTPS